MDANNIERHYFADILQKLENSFDTLDETDSDTTENNEDNEAKADNIDWQNYAASHPATRERINTILAKN